MNHGSLLGGKLAHTACTIQVDDFLSISSSLRVLSTSCVLVMLALRFTFPISRWGFAGRKSADAALHEKVPPADLQFVSFKMPMWTQPRTGHTLRLQVDGSRKDATPFLEASYLT